MDTNALNSDKTKVNTTKQDGIDIRMKMDKMTGSLFGSVKVDFICKRKAELCRALNQRLNNF